ncbi:hypothetical protein NQ315_004005, partial [Exocentrus adspersus]
MNSENGENRVNSKERWIFDILCSKVCVKGAVTLVTGGASGLGKATVERLVQQCGKVVLCDLPNSKGNEIAKTLGEDKVIFAPVN